MFLDTPLTLYGGEGTEPFLGCFVTGTDSATMSYIVVRAVPALSVRRGGSDSLPAPRCGTS